MTFLEETEKALKAQIAQTIEDSILIRSGQGYLITGEAPKLHEIIPGVAEDVFNSIGKRQINRISIYERN